MFCARAADPDFAAEASTRGPIGKMYYVNFDQHIMLKFGVVLENWPLTKFAAPGSFSTIPILSLLYNAFESGVTRFRSLTDEEWLEWLQAHKAGHAPPSVTSSAILTVEEEDFSTTSVSEAALDPPATPASEPTPTVTSAEQVALSTELTGANNNIAPSGAVGISAALSPSPSTPDVNMAENSNLQLTVARGQKRPFQQVNDGNFINNFTSADGVGIVQVTKKPRKTRSDAGKKRGPRNKKTMAAQASMMPAPAALSPTPAASAVPVPTASGSASSTPTMVSTSISVTSSPSAPTASGSAPILSGPTTPGPLLIESAPAVSTLSVSATGTAAQL